MMDKLKSIPIPIWIGLALVLIVIFLVNSKATSTPQPTAGPVTASTVGTPGQQSGAGTDQQLGNLSQMTQGGFAQILQNQEQMQREITVLQSGNRTGFSQTATVPPNAPELVPQLSSGMNGVGTGMTQFGSSIQQAQNGAALDNAYFWSNPAPVNNWQG